MLRTFLIALSQAAWARRLAMSIPLARRTALRFVAGEELDDALRVVRELNQAGMLVTLDLLGEHTEDAAAAEQAAQQIIHTLERLAEGALRASLSIKLTQIGLKLDEELCAANLARVLQAASRHHIFVRIDMEESACVEATLRLYRLMRREGFSNLGVVIQSYLYRSQADTRALLAEEAPIRLVKGAYKEPPELAYPQKTDVDAAFDRLSAMILQASLEYNPSPADIQGTWPPLAAIATHDEARIQFAEHEAQSLGLEKSRLEFQMLYGIRRELQRALQERGYPVRVYVPFGREWYPYFMRRLAERPANLWFFITNLFKR